MTLRKRRRKERRTKRFAHVERRAIGTQRKPPGGGQTDAAQRADDRQRQYCRRRGRKKRKGRRRVSGRALPCVSRGNVRMARAGSEKFVLEVVQRHEVANVRRRQRRATLPLVLVLAADANDSVSVQAHVEVQTKQTDGNESRRRFSPWRCLRKMANRFRPCSSALCCFFRSVRLQQEVCRNALPAAVAAVAACLVHTAHRRRPLRPIDRPPPAAQSRSGPSLSRTCARQTALSSHIATSMICRADGHWPAARARRASMTTSPSTLSSCSTRQRYARAPLPFPSSLGDTRV